MRAWARIGYLGDSKRQLSALGKSTSYATDLRGFSTDQEQGKIKSVKIRVNPWPELDSSLHKLCRPSRQPFNSLCSRRMRRK